MDSEFSLHQLRPEVGWIADDNVGLGPDGGRAVIVDDGVAALDVVKRLQDRLPPDVKAAATHPLNFTDPDRDARQLGGVGIDLNSKQCLRPCRRKARGKPKQLALNRDPPFDVLEFDEGEIEKV